MTPALNKPIPEFEALATGGVKFTPQAYAGKIVVLYFYPAAFTKGCTIEAHEFADAVDEYKRYGATVIGVSHDDIATLTRFSVSECRSKFAVAADETGHIIESFDAALPLVTKRANRVSYVIAPDGTEIATSPKVFEG